MPIKRVYGLAVAGCGALLLGFTANSPADARDLRFAIGFPEGADVHKAAEIYADKLEDHSDGALSATVYPLSLLNFEEMTGGIGSGIADVGHVLTSYFVSEFPHFNMIGESTFLINLLETDDVTGRMAYVGAMSEFVFHHCPECHDEFLAQNHVFTGNGAGGIYELACDDEMTSVDDIEGSRIRPPGSNWARWVEAMDASPIFLSGNEIFEGLSQGVVDCVVISTQEMRNLGLIDATTDMTLHVPGGTYASNGLANTNADVWQGLDDEQRESMLRSGAEMAAEGLFIYFEQEEGALDDLRDEGITIHEPDADLMAATEEFFEQDMETITEQYAREHGVERAEEMLGTFEELLATWVERVEGIDSAEALAEAYWEYSFSNVDVSEYGE